MNKLSNRISLTLALAGVVALAACSKPAAPPAPASAPAPAATPAPAAAAPSSSTEATVPMPPAVPVRVDSVMLGNAVTADGKIATPVGVFGTKDTFYAAVGVTTTVPNAAISMRWKYQDGQTVADNAKTIAEPSTGVIDDKLTKASGWPIGNYTLEVVSDGKPISSITFSVK